MLSVVNEMERVDVLKTVFIVYSVRVMRKSRLVHNQIECIGLYIELIGWQCLGSRNIQYNPLKATLSLTHPSRLDDSNC